MKITKHSYTNDIKIGDKFGKLTATFYDKERCQWYCKCDCGGHVYAASNKLIKGYYTACNCKRGLGKKIESGDRCNQLTVVKFDGEKELWLCKCDCGNFSYVKSNHFKRGIVKSCGCQKFEPKLHLRRPNNETLKLNLFQSYKDNARHRNKVFDLSKENFLEFIDRECYYCGNLPNNTNKRFLKYDKTFRYNGIDRMDNTKGYTKDNCVTCCETCNKAKLKMNIDDFKNWIKRIYEKQKLENI